MVAGFLSGLAGFGLNQVSSALASSRQWKYTQRAMMLQDELNRNYFKWSSQNGPSFSRKGYEKAGYNPLLALGSNLSGNGAIYSGSASMSDSDQGSEAISSALDAMRLKNENKLAKSQVKVNESQSDLNTQQTYKTLADEIASRSNSAVYEATEQKILNDIYWDNEKNKELIKQIQAETKYINERSRGFSASSSKSYGGSISPNFGIDKKKGKVGFGISGSGNYSESKSRSW